MEMSDFFWFSDAQWARIASLLPTDTRGMARVDDRRVLSGIVHALRNGGRWADCPRDGEVQMSCNALRQPDFPVDRECVGETRFHRLMAEFISHPTHR